MRYARIEEWRQHHPVATMCRILEVSESGYHAWRQRPPSARKQENLRLEIEIKAAHQRTRETYGPERLQSDLADHGIQASVYRIKRIRTRLGLRCNSCLSRRFSARSLDNSIASGVTCLLPAPWSVPDAAALTQLRRVWSPSPSSLTTVLILCPSFTRLTASSLNSAV